MTASRLLCLQTLSLVHVSMIQYETKKQEAIACFSLWQRGLLIELLHENLRAQTGATTTENLCFCVLLQRSTSKFHVSLIIHHVNQKRPILN